MITWLYSFLTICFCFSSSLPALSKKKAFHPMTMSVVIPCHYKHACYLFGALEAYAKQSELPIEVVISLSEIGSIPPETMAELEQSQWPFELKILQHYQPMSEGGNRNEACKASRGDIIVCSDADDLPHFQRLEVIKYFFENYPISFLLHTFTHDTAEWGWLEPSTIPWMVPSYINEGCSHANGAPAFTRDVFKKLQWDTAFRQLVDVDFNRAAFRCFPNHILVKSPIYLYRDHLSSYLR